MEEVKKVTPSRNCLYRCFDLYGNLLYVGISFHPLTRMMGHARTSDWYREVARIDVEWVGDREGAKAAERAAVREERPLWNIHHAKLRPEKRKIRKPKPKKIPKTKMSCRFLMRISPEDKTNLIEMCESEGLSISGWVRKEVKKAYQEQFS